MPGERLLEVAPATEVIAISGPIFPKSVVRGAAAPVWFASLRAASRSERRAREDAQFAALRSISDVAHEATRAGAEPIENHDRRTLIKGDHIIGVKQRFPVAWAAPKRSWLTGPAPTASS